MGQRSSSEGTPLVAEASISFTGDASAAVSEIVTDVTSGQDGLGSIVKQVSKRHAGCDTFFHAFNHIGFDLFERHRIKVMSLAILIGCAVFATALCGFMGLFPFYLDTLPWAIFNDARVNLHYLSWWVCPSGIDDLECNARFLSPNNTKLWEHLGPIAIDMGPWPSCAPFDRANPSLDDYSCAVTALLSSERPITTVSWHMNQWGLCAFANEGWVESRGVEVG